MLFIFPFFVQAQTHLDSLWKIWDNTALHDTVRLNAMDKIIWDGFLYSNSDSAYSLASIAYRLAEEKALKRYQAKAVNAQGVVFLIQGKYDNALKKFDAAKKYYEELNDRKGIATSLNNIGLAYNNKGDLDNAMDYFSESLEIREALGDKKGMATSIHTIGNVYQSRGDFGNALKHYLRSLKLKEETGDKKGMANTLNNLGLLYAEQNETDKALDYYKQSLKIREEIKDSYGIAVSLSNMAEIYFRRTHYNMAMDLCLRCLKLQENIGDKEGAGITYRQIGNIYREQGDYAQAHENFQRSLKIREQIGDRQGTANALNNLARNYFEQNNLSKALANAKKALAIAEETGAAREIQEAARLLYLVYSTQKKSAEALTMHELFVKMKDSAESAQIKKELAAQESRYRYEKQALADSLEFDRQRQLREMEYNAQLQTEKTRRYVLYAGVIFLLLLGVTGYRSYQIKKKDNILLSKQKAEISEKNESLEFANSEINKQKAEIEDRNKDILDSISYAKRLQLAILPSEEDFRKFLPSAFVLYLPKDIVSGDFYFLNKKGDNVFFGVADCTGHGVPGAFVSFVGHKALSRAIDDLKLVSPGKILDSVRSEVEHTFDKNEKGEVKDGMDISLCCWNRKNNTLHFAGAHHTLYWVTTRLTKPIVEKAALHSDKAALIEIKGNRYGVGAGQAKEAFTTLKVNCKPGDMLYFSSDGFADQFGGEDGKKFKTAQLKKLLLEIHNKSVEQQKERLLQVHNEWKGALEQVDDVCIIGVRVEG